MDVESYPIRSPESPSRGDALNPPSSSSSPPSSCGTAQPRRSPSRSVTSTITQSSAMSDLCFLCGVWVDAVPLASRRRLASACLASSRASASPYTWSLQQFVEIETRSRSSLTAPTSPPHSLSPRSESQSNTSCPAWTSRRSFRLQAGAHPADCTVSRKADQPEGNSATAQSHHRRG